MIAINERVNTGERQEGDILSIELVNKNVDIPFVSTIILLLLVN